MTDAEAITLLDSLVVETQEEENALESARSEFASARQVLNSAMTDVESKIASMDRHVRFAIEYFGA